MRLLVLAHNLHVGGGRSVGVNLVSELGRDDAVDKSMVVAPLGEDYAEAIRLGGSDGLQVDVRSLAKRVTFDLAKLPSIVRGFKPDWVLCLGNNPMKSGPYRQAVLVHDPYILASDLKAACEGYSKSFAANKSLLRRRFATLSHGVDIVFCQTEAASIALMSNFPELPEPVVVPNVVSGAVIGVESEPVKPFGPPRPNGILRLLTVSRYYPHKNFEAVLNAFEQFPDLTKNVSWTITIDAESSPGARRLVERVSEEPFSTIVTNVGPVDQRVVRSMYGESDAAILPSLLESFSANYAESMTFGTPILTSDRDFARGVCGDAAIYFDPLDPESIAESIARLRDDEDLRDELAAAGRERIGRYPDSWRPVAEIIVRSLAEAGHVRTRSKRMIDPSD